VTQVDGSLNVVGNLNVSGASTVSGTNGIQSSNYVAGTSGWKFDGTSLEANTGIIGNGALANPVIPGVVNLYVSFFGLGFPGYAEVAGIDLTVPNGCTQLQFTGTAAIDCYNPKTTGGNNGVGGDYLYTQIRIGSKTSPGNWATGVSGSNGNATSIRSYSDLLTGLTPGSTVRASIYGSSDYGIASNSGNLASLSAQLTWLR
jgi:hypothetical protein